MTEIQFVKRLPEAKLPVYGTEGAAGADVSSVEYFTLYPGESKLIDTGLDCRIPDGWEIQVRPRSGLAAKNMITVLNSPGTVDCDYTGPLKVILVNHSNTPFTIHIGDRIAQIVPSPIHRVTFAFTDQDKNTERGSDGFGSTGVK